MIESTMKAARVHARGAAKFSIDTIPTPEPGPGQVLVRVESAGVNFSDVKRRPRRSLWRGPSRPTP